MGQFRTAEEEIEAAETYEQVTRPIVRKLKNSRTVGVDIAFDPDGAYAVASMIEHMAQKCDAYDEIHELLDTANEAMIEIDSTLLRMCARFAIAGAALGALLAFVLA